MEYKIKIAIIGLGYVGLPLAVTFANKYPIIGYDINPKRVKELNNSIDHTLAVDTNNLKDVITNKTKTTGLSVTTELEAIKTCNYYIITVPTPTDKNNRPDLTLLFKASETVAGVIKKNDTIIYESTVYPGVTEEECIPIIEQISGLKLNIDFFAGYSPERINPGDKEHTLTQILKVTSGSTPETAERINSLYKSIITAGTYKAPSIKVAEAAKVIENSQRDINIAFVNELAKICSKLKIDTQDVLNTAATKWNFLPFKPGLVGGHCIGVDPYFLAQKAEEIGYNPEIILAGRRMNDTMGSWVAGQIIKLMIKKGQEIKNRKVLCLGITFKENCPDIRNTKVIDVITELTDFGCAVDVYDPWADPKEVKKEYGLTSIQTQDKLKNNQYDAIILAVAHHQFLNMNLLKYKRNKSSIIYDIKGVLPRDMVDYRL